ncbi:alpha/beta fold hydrolase [Bdellovibrio bacteriovorus]|nr:alpha/beta hydrolase [Bdellovibrio bacteriovorus]
MLSRITGFLCLMCLVSQAQAKANLCEVWQPAYSQNAELPAHHFGVLNTGGGEVYYRYFDDGSTGPLVVLFSGLPGANYLSDFAARLYSKGKSVLILDYPGKMNTSLAGKASIQFLMDQFYHVFHALGISRHESWYFVGVSMGGPIAAGMATNADGRVKGVIFMNPVGLDVKYSPTQKIAQVPGLNLIVAPWVMKSEVRKNIEQGLGCSGRYLNLLREQNLYLRSYQDRVNYLNLISNYAMKNSTGVYRSFAKAHVASLIIGGDDMQDSRANREQINQLRVILPKARFVAVRNTSHFPFIENPADTLDEVVRFVDSLN